METPMPGGSGIHRAGLVAKMGAVQRSTLIVKASRPLGQALSKTGLINLNGRKADKGGPDSVSTVDCMLKVGWPICVSRTEDGEKLLVTRPNSGLTATRLAISGLARVSQKACRESLRTFAPPPKCLRNDVNQAPSYIGGYCRLSSSNHILNGWGLGRRTQWLTIMSSPTVAICYDQTPGKRINRNPTANILRDDQHMTLGRASVKEKSGSLTFSLINCAAKTDRTATEAVHV
jgi:hypothetical protein